MTEDGLHKLAGEWRDELREKNLAGRILADFNIIKGLRAQKCPWHRIARAMGVNPDSLRKLFLWTEAEIAAKRLEVPATLTARPAAPLVGDAAQPKLLALIAAGPDPTRGLQNLVLARFDDIRAARALLWGWREIAEALGMPGRGKALSVAYARVRKGVEAGRLEPAAAVAPLRTRH